MATESSESSIFKLFMWIDQNLWDSFVELVSVIKKGKQGMKREAVEEALGMWIVYNSSEEDET